MTKDEITKELINTITNIRDYETVLYISVIIKSLLGI